MLLITLLIMVVTVATGLTSSAVIDAAILDTHIQLLNNLSNYPHAKAVDQCRVLSYVQSKIVKCL